MQRVAQASQSQCEIGGLGEQGLQRDERVVGGVGRLGCRCCRPRTVVALLVWEREGQVWQQAFVDQGYKGVDGFRGEERIGGEKERMCKRLQRAGLVGEM